MHATNPKLNGEQFKAYYQKACEVEEIVKQWNCARAQLALTWLVSQKQLTSISGALNIAEIENNLAACEIDLNDDAHQGISKKLLNKSRETRTDQVPLFSILPGLNRQIVIEYFLVYHLPDTD